MVVIAGLVIAALAAVSALHLAWALGSTWPRDSEIALARSVAGFRGIEKMPPRAASAAVALALFVVAVAASLLVVDMPAQAPIGPARAIALGAAAVFLVRGAAGFSPAWRRLTPEAPFARLDRLFYSPLCLALGAGLFALCIRGPLGM